VRDPVLVPEYANDMQRFPIGAALVLASLVLNAQEPDVPKDSTRITVTGCLKGRMLTSVRREEPEPVSTPVEDGRRFRLSGPKKVLSEIQAQGDQLVSVTGLVKLSQLSPATQGISIGGGGSIRLGGGPPNRDPTGVDPRRDPLANQTLLDIESWRPLPESCKGLVR
jgi:hypothetical protein